MKEEQTIKSGGYRVPEGYFDQMRAEVMGQVAQWQDERQADVRTVRPAWRSAVAFAASFAALVVLAIGGYYLTGYPTHQTEIAAANTQQDMWLYGVDESDLYGGTETTTEQGNATMFAEAAIDYLETFGSLPSGELSSNE